MPLRRLDLRPALVFILEKRRRRVSVGAHGHGRLQEHLPIVQLDAPLEMLVIQVVVHVFRGVHSQRLRDPLHEAVARHRVRRDAVEVKVLDADLVAPALQVMPLLLRLPAGLAAPLPQQSHPIGFLELGALGVVRLEEERHAQHREAHRRVAARRVLHRPHRVLEVPLADVAVGSHGVRDELDDAARRGGRRRRRGVAHACDAAEGGAQQHFVCSFATLCLQGVQCLLDCCNDARLQCYQLSHRCACCRRHDCSTISRCLPKQ